MLELVAPAGEMDSLRLAIANGADAVYLGGKSFSARQYAKNFDEEEMAAAIRLAHLHRVRVYVTMNTLLREEEMEEALTDAERVLAAGADALIVQDLGFLTELRRRFPAARLHASTQMTVVNAATVRELGKLGVARVVLAREATEEEVKTMAAVGPEVEVFVHGALCYSYSGQCLMSSLIGGRSGNRGRCAQPCRLAYELIDPDGRTVAAEGKYLLSPRDLCLLPHLPRLASAGVKALKIEGRMKNPAYVATVVRVYRQALDRFVTRPAEFTPTPEERRELAQIFNRGFTPGFFLGDQGAAYQSLTRPNNRGCPVGRVMAVDRNRDLVSMVLTAPVSRGDMLEIWVKKGGRVGLVLERMFVEERPVETAMAGEVLTVPLRAQVRPGDRVFRVLEAGLVAKALAPLRTGEGIELPFFAHIHLRPGEPVVLTLEDDEGHRVVVESDLPAQAAHTRPLDEETVRHHIGRTGGSGWRPREIAVDMAPGTMVPLSALNHLRRRGLATLEEARLASYVPPPYPSASSAEFPAVPPREETASFSSVSSVRSPRLAATVGDPAEARAALAAGADRLYLATWLHTWPDEELEKLLAMARRRGGEVLLALPRVAPERETTFWTAELVRARRLGLHGARLGDLGFLREARRYDLGLLALDFSLNVTNSWSLRYLLAAGARLITLSPELTLTQIRPLATAYPGRTEIIVHGRLAMMLSAQCLLGAVVGGKRTPRARCRRPCEKGSYHLRDRKGILFPLIPDRFCRLHIENSVDLSVLPELEKFVLTGADFRLELAGRGPEYAEAVVRAYREGLLTVAEKRWARRLGEREEAALTRFSPAGFTRGHFFRGVE
ncbi:MAG: U32 family peptidase [Firmicutes bacterium]|nr:U32 family peptidase [Bacillota bacterium]